MAVMGAACLISIMYPQMYPYHRSSSNRRLKTSVCIKNVAEEANLAANSLLWMPLVLQGNSEPLDM